MQNKQETEDIGSNLGMHMGSLSGQVRSLESGIQGRPAQQSSTRTIQDQSDCNARNTVSTLGQWAHFLKQCLKAPTLAPAFKGTSDRNGSTFKWLQSPDDEKQCAGNIGGVGRGGPAIYVEQADGKEGSHQ